MKGLLRALRFTAFFFACTKKSTDSNQNGLPSVALAKDGGGCIVLQQTFLPEIFYAQGIKKFVGTMLLLIESSRIAKIVSGNQKNTGNNAQDFSCRFSDF